MTIKQERLKKLADFLATFPPVRFNIVKWTTGVPSNLLDPNNPEDCGTTACAVGCCPIVFPDDWMYSYNDMPRLRSAASPPDCYNLISDQAGIYFGLNHREVDIFFMPDTYLKAKRGPKDVANRIYAFLAGAKSQAWKDVLEETIDAQSEWEPDDEDGEED